jgi:gamma-glutamylcyclotransferase (GGCT)/AIG2-like uncharacterized protein YtfP
MLVNELFESREHPEPVIYYFAYGMLTDPNLMPGAEFLGKAILKNFKFEMFTYANVFPEAGSSVQGSLWSIDRQLLKSLDETEGYPYLYDRKKVPVFFNNKRYEADVYFMTPETRKQLAGTKPSKSYIKRIVRGYDNANIDQSQLTDAVNSSGKP